MKLVTGFPALPLLLRILKALSPFTFGENSISHFKKSNFAWQEIQFKKKTNLLLEKVQFHIEQNPNSYKKKSNFTLEEIQFHNGRNLILPINQKFTHSLKVHP